MKGFYRSTFYHYLVGVLLGFLFGFFLSMSIANASTDLRICASFSTVLGAIQDEGFHPWFSYRAGEADFKVMYWRNWRTKELYRIAPQGNGRWCILGGGDEVMVYTEGER